MGHIIKQAQWRSGETAKQQNGKLPKRTGQPSYDDNNDSNNNPKVQPPQVREDADLLPALRVLGLPGEHGLRAGPRRVYYIML